MMKKRNLVTYTLMQIFASEENVKQRYPWVANGDSDSNAASYEELTFCAFALRNDKEKKMEKSSYFLIKI